MRGFLAARGEPVGYLHPHTAGLIALAESNALKQMEDEFDEAMRKTNGLLESALRRDKSFIHYSTGEGVDTGMWGLVSKNDSLADRVEVAIVSYLQKQRTAIFLEVEEELNNQFAGLMTPSKGLIYAVLNSYARKDGANWSLREEDVASARRGEMANMFNLLEEIGGRLDYASSKDDKTLTWLEHGKPARRFYVLVSALVRRALEGADSQTIIVIPGGRAALVAHKQERDPSLKEQLKKYRLVKYRLLRSLFEVPILTRETFEEQIASDPVEKAAGQLMMF
jgi:hypothetical protein